MLLLLLVFSMFSLSEAIASTESSRLLEWDTDISMSLTATGLWIPWLKDIRDCYCETRLSIFLMTWSTSPLPSSDGSFISNYYIEMSPDDWVWDDFLADTATPASLWSSCTSFAEEFSMFLGGEPSSLSMSISKFDWDLFHKGSGSD